MSSAGFPGFENSLETVQEIQDSHDLLIQLHNKAIDATSSWEEIASLVLSSPPPKSEVGISSLPELVNAECSIMDVSCYSNSNNQFLRSICSNGRFQVSTSSCFLSQKEHCSDQRYSSMAEGNNNMKVVGRYSVEERRERIDRYRAKRALRNFNKTIKYGCRKRLADGRQRIRGRFVRNDEINFWMDDDFNKQDDR